jgi:hypothetical protein
MPVLLFISGCGTVAPDNDQAVEQAKPALACQERTRIFNSARPLDSVNFLVAKTSVSSAYPIEPREGL